VKLDVANFFGSLNQHELINVLSDSGYPKPLYSRLEALLTSFTGDRSSRGILQGMYPSDLFGNFYLAPIDTVLAEHGVSSARYVDDIYVFVRSMKAAGALLRELIPALRSYDLTLNEAKSKVVLKSSLITEEPDLEALFSDAVEEISSQIEDDDFNADYGFQSEWDDDDGEDEGHKDETTDLELKATKLLFDSIDDYAGHEESIERFCLPLFAKADSDHAVEHVMDAFKKRPAMSQIFASYLANFLEDDAVRSFLLGLLQDDSLVDWQKMWVLAALSQIAKASDTYVKVAMAILKDGDHHEALRGAAAVYVGRFGEHPRRKALVALYGSVSSYIQSAIYFSSRNWPGVERSNAKANWGSHNPLNSPITAALTKK
jgi:Reverse transcriptase (RNA-dependent DNA polymerase)